MKKTIAVFLLSLALAIWIFGDNSAYNTLSSGEFVFFWISIFNGFVFVGIPVALCVVFRRHLLATISQKKIVKIMAAFVFIGNLSNDIGDIPQSARLSFYPILISPDFSEAKLEANRAATPYFEKLLNESTPRFCYAAAYSLMSKHRHLSLPAEADGIDSWPMANIIATAYGQPLENVPFDSWMEYAKSKGVAETCLDVYGSASSEYYRDQAGRNWITPRGSAYHRSMSFLYALAAIHAIDSIGTERSERKFYVKDVEFLADSLEKTGYPSAKEVYISMLYSINRNSGENNQESTKDQPAQVNEDDPKKVETVEIRAGSLSSPRQRIDLPPSATIIDEDGKKLFFGFGTHGNVKMDRVFSTKRPSNVNGNQKYFQALVNTAIDYFLYFHPNHGNENTCFSVIPDQKPDTGYLALCLSPNGIDSLADFRSGDDMRDENMLRKAFSEEASLFFVSGTNEPLQPAEQLTSDFRSRINSLYMEGSDLAFVNNLIREGQREMAAERSRTTEQSPSSSNDYLCASFDIEMNCGILTTCLRRKVCVRGGPYGIKEECNHYGVQFCGPRGTYSWTASFSNDKGCAGSFNFNGRSVKLSVYSDCRSAGGYEY